MQKRFPLARCLAAEQTQLQQHTRSYLRTLGEARNNLNAEQRQVFASIGVRALRKAFAAELVVLEAEEALKRAA
jgi:hypothetical protein